MLSILKNLVDRPSPSGAEFNVTNYILMEISPYADCRIDALGNIIAFKKGLNKREDKLMVSAHMDEVGFIVTGITEEGFLTFSNVGGILTSALVGKRVMIDGKVGVIGIKATHLCKKDEREKLPESDELYIDIGAKDKADAESIINLGDIVNFENSYELFGDGFIRATALDDKAGVAILIDIIKNEEIAKDTYFVFTVQEEIGARGAKTATYSINPDKAIVVEATTAGDIATAEEENKICKVGDGAVISFMDRGTVYNKEMYNKIFNLAKTENIKCQIKQGVAGGNDASNIHITGSGVKTSAISIPCRYIHSASCVTSVDDIYAVRKLTLSAINNI